VPESPTGPLAGLRVIELGSLIAGPFATRLLADLGADVVKVEAPGRPDPMREWGVERYKGRGLWWPIQARGKRLVTCNLRVPEGQELCRKLAAESDVLVENFKPGTMERWGLGPDQLHKVNPGLIYARVSGYGQTGPYAERPGFASAGEAMGGMRHLNGFPDGPPPRAGLSLGDSLAALYATIGILAALRHRDASGGTGQVVDASIIESCLSMLESIPAEYDKTGTVRQPSGTVLAKNAPSNVYRSRDGKWVVIAANSDNLYPRLCKAMDREELIDDPRFSTHELRGENQVELDELIGEWVVEHDAAEVDRLMLDAGVVSAPVYTIKDIFEDPHVKEREMLVGVEDPEIGEVIGPGVFPKLSRTPGRSEHRAPLEQGEHNAEVYGELLGIDEGELGRLQSEGVI
jgi:succinyl-CoA---D-citramalate CoA-transferase